MKVQQTSSIKVLIAATVGMAFSLPAVTVASFTVLMLPLTRAFGWERGEVSLAMTIVNIATIVMYPTVGWLIDRVGLRKVLIPSVILYGVILASHSLLSGQLWQFYVGYALLAVGGAGAAAVSYIRLIVAWFTDKRGLALGTSLAGMGVSVALLPMLAQSIVDIASWRMAYVVLGLLSILAVLPLVVSWAWYPDQQSSLSVAPKSTSHAAREVSGLEFREAIKSRSFILLAISFGLLGILTSAVPTHLVPLLVDRGVAAMDAAIMASALGFSLIAGRFLMGFLMDRIFAPLLVMSVCAIAVIGLMILLVGASEFWLVVSIALIGFAIGADGDFMSYLASRYIGLRAFSRVYGILLSVFATGLSVGPALMGYSSHVSGNYDLALRILIATTVTATVPFLFLGRYSDQARDTIRQPTAVPRT